MSANKDESVLPEWLTVDFVQMALGEYQERELTVLNMVAKPVLNTGEHVGSVMYRIEATVTFKTTDDQQVMFLILKTSSEKDIQKGSPLFEREIKMYGQVLPALKPMLDTCSIIPFWPKLVYQAFEPVPVIIFEDLAKSGYTVPFVPYKFEEAKKIYSHLAFIHASTYYLHQINGSDFNEFNTGLFNTPQEALDNFFGLHMNFLIEEMVQWPGFEVHTEKFKAFRLRYQEVGRKVSKCIAGGYNVMNHGDFHSRNTLLKAQEKNGDQAQMDYIMLDFQISIWTSPGLDIVYSLYMMVNAEARERRDELIKHYHDEFCRILGLLKFDKPIPTLEDLNKEIERFGFLEVMLCVCFLPFSFVDFTKIKDAAQMFGDVEKALEFKKSMFRNEKYQELVKKEMPRFLKMGFMDVDA